MRIPVLQRERASILFLRRRFKYSINQLATAFGRSASLIHKIVKFNTRLGVLRWMDNRYVKTYVKKIAAARQTRQLAFFMGLWQAFILGEEDRPP